jgi:vacuolar-type H+-ATPase subunit I/STV1
LGKLGESLIEQIYIKNIMSENKKPSFIQNVGKSIRRTVRNLFRGPKKDSSYKKSLKKLQNLREPTADVSKNLKEERNVITKLRKEIAEDIKIEEKRKQLLQRMQKNVKNETQKEKEFMRKLKHEESKLKLLKKLNIPMTETDPKIVETFPDAPMSNYPSIPEHNIQITRKNRVDEDMEDDLGNVPIAFIRQISYEKRKGSNGGKKKSRKISRKKCKK